MYIYPWVYANRENDIYAVIAIIIRVSTEYRSFWNLYLHQYLVVKTHRKCGKLHEKENVL